ncbi:MAG: fibronectin type III domain-containing protein, partial [Acidobacteria bacterium]|nr:fibronectin type III domain-containing protein [Acidobacteriota bacterium]
MAGNYTLGIRIPAGSAQFSGRNESNREATLQMRVLTPGATAPEPISSLDLKASPGTRSVKLSWSLPSDNGGSAIVRYEYRYAAVGEGLGLWKSAGAEALGVTVGNLAGGREHVFEVRAVNGLGKGPIETVMATPLAGGGFGGGGGGGGGLLFPPEAPAALTALPGDGAVRLEWIPPENNGGSPIQRYEYRLKEGRGEVGEWTPIPDSAVDEVNASGFTVGGLLNGTVYAVELRAVNAAGNGQESEPVEVRMPLDPDYWSNFRAEDLEGVELTLEAFILEGDSRDRQLRFGEGLRFEEDELDGEGEVTAAEMGSYGYRYTSRTTGDLG